MMLMNVDVLPRAESLICTIRQQCRKLFEEMLFFMAWSRTYAPDPCHSRNQVDGAEMSY